MTYDDTWRTFVSNNARPGDVANLIIQRDSLLRAREVLIAAAERAEEAFRLFAGNDPGACLTAGSEEDHAIELANMLRDAVDAARKES